MNNREFRKHISEILERQRRGAEVPNEVRPSHSKVRSAVKVPKKPPASTKGK